MHSMAAYRSLHTRERASQATCRLWLDISCPCDGLPAAQSFHCYNIVAILLNGCLLCNARICAVAAVLSLLVGTCHSLGKHSS
jgi:hypothetical protein